MASIVEEVGGCSGFDDAAFVHEDDTVGRLARESPLMQWGHSSSPALAVSVCSVAGALAGAWTGYQLSRARAGILVWLSSVSVALAAAALGAMDLGIGGLVGLSVSYVASSAIAASLVRMRALQVSQNN